MTHFPDSQAEARMVEQANPKALHHWQGLPVRIISERGSLAVVSFGGDAPNQVVRRSELRRRGGAA